MRRSRAFLLTTVVGLAAAAPAAAFEVAPAGTNAQNVTVAAGPSGRALLTWIADGKRVDVSELEPARAPGDRAPRRRVRHATADRAAGRSLLPGRGGGRARWPARRRLLRRSLARLRPAGLRRRAAGRPAGALARAQLPRVPRRDR